ncbi:MAG: amidohydrolase family protein [Phycisphaerales bacterium]|nr:amidohydrolase family protein [Phycisphaerales bacterium]
MLGGVLSGEVPLIVTCNRAQDIDSVIRIAEEFKIRVFLSSASESFLLTDRIKAAGDRVAGVFCHPLMQRAVGETENQSFETPARLQQAGIPFAIQSGYEGYVPKVRVVLFEAAIAAANGLTFDQALAAITISPARLLGIGDRVGSLEVGKDGDVAMYGGDPFEYTTRCTGVVIDGKIVSDEKR